MTDTAMKDKLIDGQTYKITAPYSAGHALNEAEARVLNQVRSENIGNNLRAKLKELHAKGDGGLEEAIGLVAKADEEYVFTIANTGSGARKLDPIEREALNIAKDIIKAHLAKTGRSMSKVPDGETEDSWAEKIEGHLDALTTRDDVVKLAKQRAGAKQKVVDAALGDLAAA